MEPAEAQRALLARVVRLEVAALHRATMAARRRIARLDARARLEHARRAPVRSRPMEHVVVTKASYA